MPELNFFEYILDPIFLIPFAITAGFFAPLGWSVLVTWLKNGHKVKALQEQEKARRRARRQRRATMTTDSNNS